MDRKQRLARARYLALPYCKNAKPHLQSVARGAASNNRFSAYPPALPRPLLQCLESSYTADSINHVSVAWPFQEAGADVSTMRGYNGTEEGL